MGGGFSRVDQLVKGAPLAVIYSVGLESTQEAVKQAGGTITKQTFSFPRRRRFEFADASGNVSAVWSDLEPNKGS